MRLLLRKMIKYLFVPFGAICEATKGRRENKLLILMYHRVNDKVKSEMSVAVSDFIWQMEYLKKRGYKVISMDDAAARLRSGSVDKKTVVLTFDDGYEDFYHSAFPVLKKFDYPSLLYIVPGYMETSRVFWWDRDLGESRLMNWEQISELNRSGLVDIGSHTMNHFDLDKLEQNELMMEMGLSNEILEEKLNKRVKHFAYPRGIFTKAAMEMANTFYESAVVIYGGCDAVSNGSRAVNAGTEDQLMQLKRIPVKRSDGRWLFIARLKRWLVLEELAVRLLSGR